MAKLIGGVIAIGAGVFVAVAGTGIAGDGLVETFGGPESEREADGMLNRKAS
jgi:hypothetical protein